MMRAHSTSQCRQKMQAKAEGVRGLTLLDQLASPPPRSLLQRISSPVTPGERNANRSSTQSHESISHQISPISKHCNEVSVLLAKKDSQLKRDKPYCKDSSKESIKESKEKEIELENVKGEGEIDLSKNSFARQLGIVEIGKEEMKNWGTGNLRTEDQWISRLGKESKKTEEGKEFEKRILLGSKKHKKQSKHLPLANKKPEEPLNGQEVMLGKSSSRFEMPQDVPGTSLNRNGAISSEGTQLILTMSTVLSTLSDLCRTTSQNLENSKFTMLKSNLPNKLKRQASGTPPGQKPLKQPYLHSHTVDLSLTNIGGTSKTSSTQLSVGSTPKLSCTTKLSGISSGEDKQLHSPTLRASTIYKPTTFTHLAWRQTRSTERERNPMVSVVNSTGECATLPVVNTSMHAEDVGVPHMDKWSVLRKNQDLIPKPKYLHYNKWDLRGKLMPGVITWSLTAPPLPSPPSLSAEHPVSRTIRQEPHLFKIVTPINVPALRYFLREHPNWLFCDSISNRLEHGFWEWANINPDGYPETHDEVRPATHDNEKLEFMRKQQDIEIQKGQFSNSFGTSLLPGMFSSPTFAVPKEGSLKLRLVTDQSVGPYSVNNMCSQHEYAFLLDNMSHLGEQMLRAYNELVLGEHLVAYKSNVAEAY